MAALMSSSLLTGTPVSSMASAVAIDLLQRRNCAAYWNRFRIVDGRDTRDARRNALEHLQPLAADRELDAGESGHVATGPRQRLDQAVVHRIGEPHEHGRYGAGLIAQGQRSRAAARDDHVGRELDELLGRCLRLCALPPSPPDVETDIVLPAQLLQRLGEGGDVQLRLWIARGAAEQQADPTRAVVRLRAGCEGPIDRRRRRAAEKGNEFAPPHSVTTSPPGRPFRPAGICSCSCRTRRSDLPVQPRRPHSSPIFRPRRPPRLISASITKAYPS